MLLTRKGSQAENKASDGQKYHFFSNVLNSVVFYSFYQFRAMSKEYSDICCYFFFGGGGSMRKSQKFEKNCMQHFAQFDFLCFSLAFILKYHPILHVVKR